MVCTSHMNVSPDVLLDYARDDIFKRFIHSAEGSDAGIDDGAAVSLDFFWGVF